MTKKSNQKIKLILLYELLSRLTDEEHALSAPEIIQLMKDEDVTVTRKILMSDIELLNLYGYEICTYKKKSWYYYVRSAKLELEQVWKLIDLVSVSNLERRQKSLLFEKLVYAMKQLREGIQQIQVFRDVHECNRSRNGCFRRLAEMINPPGDCNHLGKEGIVLCF